MLKEILKHITPFDSETLEVLANLFSEEQMFWNRYGWQLKKTAYNSTYPKVAAQWLSKALYFYQSLCTRLQKRLERNLQEQYKPTSCRILLLCGRIKHRRRAYHGLVVYNLLIEMLSKQKTFRYLVEGFFIFKNKYSKMLF